MLIALPANHPLAEMDHVPVAALASEPFILFPRMVGLSLYDDIVTACRDAGFELVVTQEAPQIPSVVNLVAANPRGLDRSRLRSPRSSLTASPIARSTGRARWRGSGLAILKAQRSPVAANLMSLIA